MTLGIYLKVLLKMALNLVYPTFIIIFIIGTVTIITNDKAWLRKILIKYVVGGSYE